MPLLGVTALVAVVYGARVLPFGLGPGRWIEEVRHPIDAHGGNVRDVAFAPGGRALGTLSAGVIRLFDDSGVRRVGLSSTTQALTFGADPEQLVSAGTEGEIRLWSRGRSQTKAHPDAVFALAFDPAMETLLVGGRSGILASWHLTGDPGAPTLAPMLPAHPPGSGTILRLAISSQTGLAAFGDQAGEARVWRAATGETLWQAQLLDHPVEALALSSEGRLAIASRSTIELREAANGRLLRSLGGHIGRVNDLAFSPDGHLLASAGGDGTVRIWDLGGEGRLDRVLDAHRGGALALDFAPAPDWWRLVTAGADRAARVWDVRDGELEKVYGAPPTALAASPDGRSIAVGNAGGEVQLWQRGQLAQGPSDLGTKLGVAEVTCLAFDATGSWLVAHDRAGARRVLPVRAAGPSGNRPEASAVPCPPLPGRFELETAAGGLTMYDPRTGDELSTAGQETYRAVVLPRRLLDRFLGSHRLVVLGADDQLVIGRLQPWVSAPLLGTFLLSLGALAAGWRWRLSVLALRRRRRQLYAPLVDSARRFFEHAGAVARQVGERAIEIESAPAGLARFTPLPALVAPVPEPADLDELAKRAGRSATPQSVGLLIYEQPPDALVRVRMAELRLSRRLVPIPLSLAVVERAIAQPESCYGVLSEYLDRYLPGADLFDDRNAIGDTLSFFGRSDLLHRLEHDLLGLQSVGLFGLRKSGKTSVLLQLGFLLRHHPVVHVDLQPFAGNPRFGAGVLRLVLEQLGKLAAMRGAAPPPELLRLDAERPVAVLGVRFLEVLSELLPLLQTAGYAAPVLIFFDEIERILPGPSTAAEEVEEFNGLFGTLRAASQQGRHLALAVVDVYPDCTRINRWARGRGSNPLFGFLKEIFLGPFESEDTQRMLSDIGELMGRRFDAETSTEIHRLAGGNPFVARQLASFLHRELAAKETPVGLEEAAQHLEHVFARAGFLARYYPENVWAALDRPGYRAARPVLRSLSGSGIDGPGRTLSQLSADLRQLRRTELLEVLVWMEGVGLVARTREAGEDRYRLLPGLLARWLRMELGDDEPDLAGEKGESWQRS